VLTLEQVDPEGLDWDALDRRPDRVLFQTREWLTFLARTQGADPVVASVRDGNAVVGWFAGAVVRRFGVRILGSPFPGWTTGSMGFDLDPGVPRVEAVRALPRFAFGSLGCLHVELKDRWAQPEELDAAGFVHGPTLTYEIGLGGGESEIFARMTSASRRAIRKAEKSGVTVEEVEEADDDSFVPEYYAQLEDVFARQGLKPTYPVERVRELVRALRPAQKILLLRARDPDGRSIATGVFPGHNRAAYFWGGASLREHQILRPNEAIMWHAARAWHRRGVVALDLGGGGDYKLKYGPTEVVVPFGRRARVPGLLRARDVAARVMSRRLYRGTATVPAGVVDSSRS
jgi:hypothetical protein